MSGELTKIGEGLFRVVRRGYDREQVDGYVAQLQRRIQELQENPSSDDAVQMALAQVGEDVSAVLQQSHQTATQIVGSARTEAEQMLGAARTRAEHAVQAAEQEASQTLTEAKDEAADHRRQADSYAAEVVANAERRVHDLDLDTDRIWAERERIVSDARDLSRQLQGIAEIAAERFPSVGDDQGAGRAAGADGRSRAAGNGARA
jgi:cell division septum initiation protein DivIVA